MTLLVSASSWVWPLGWQHRQEIRGREESEVVVLFPSLSLREVTVGLPCPLTKCHSCGPVALSIPDETKMKELASLGSRNCFLATPLYNLRVAGCIAIISQGYCTISFGFPLPY